MDRRYGARPALPLGPGGPGHCPAASVPMEAAPWGGAPALDGAPWRGVDAWGPAGSQCLPGSLASAVEDASHRPAPHPGVTGGFGSLGP